MATQTQPAGQLSVPLSAIVVGEGFNWRNHVERAELARLTKSIDEHGLMQPLVICPDGEGYRLIDGERRYRACAEAQIVEVRDRPRCRRGDRRARHRAGPPIWMAST